MPVRLLTSREVLVISSVRTPVSGSVLSAGRPRKGLK